MQNGLGQECRRKVEGARVCYCVQILSGIRERERVHSLADNPWRHLCNVPEAHLHRASEFGNNVSTCRVRPQTFSLFTFNGVFIFSPFYPRGSFCRPYLKAGRSGNRKTTVYWWPVRRVERRCLRKLSTWGKQYYLEGVFYRNEYKQIQYEVMGMMT